MLHAVITTYCFEFLQHLKKEILTDFCFHEILKVCFVTLDFLRVIMLILLIPWVHNLYKVGNEKNGFYHQQDIVKVI